MKILSLILFALSIYSVPAHAQRGFRGGGGSGERIEPEDLKFEMGVAAIPDRATYEKLSYQGTDTGRDSYLDGIEYVKFIIDKPETKDTKVYFMNTNNYNAHPPFMGMVGLGRSGAVRGAICYLPRLKAPNGDLGLYIFDFQERDSYAFAQIKSYYDALVARAPFLKGRLAFHPLHGNVAQCEQDMPKYKAANLPVHLDSDNRTHIAFLPLNPGSSYGLLRIMNDDVRPSPRDILICKTLPNQMPRMAGVISEVRQTPAIPKGLRSG